MNSPYSEFTRMVARVQWLIDAGYSAEEAAQIVAETWKPVRPPGA